MNKSIQQLEPVSRRPATATPLGNQVPATALGIAHTTLLPSIALHGGLSVIAYGIARTTNRVDLKDYLWATGMVTNAWYTSVGRHVVSGCSFGEVVGGLDFYQKALLGAVTAWGARLTYQVVSRSLTRDGDDARYVEAKKQPGFWNKDGLMLFGLEAIFQAIIALPFTTVFRTDELTGFTGATRDLAQYARWAAAGLFTTGLALEVLSDWQLDAHKHRQIQENGGNVNLCTTGVWSIVRHPNYLGDALCHFAFPLWCYGSRLFTPVQLLGPLANYFFLRFIGGDKENESSQLDRYAKSNPKKHAQLQDFKEEKNSFWPGIKEVVNPWMLAMVGIGALGALAETWLEGNIAGYAVAGA